MHPLCVVCEIWFWLSHMAKIFPSKDGDADGAVYQVTLVGVYFKGPVK